MRRATLPLILFLLALLAPPGAAGAEVQRVAYADRSDYPEAVSLAVRAWNRASTRIRLVPSDDPQKIVVPIDSQRTLTGDPAALGGALGVQINGRRFETFSLAQQSAVVAHAIGHALRLPHDDANGCSIMSPALHDALLAPSCRPPGPGDTGRFRCGPNRRDGKKLAARYGGRAKRTDGYCKLQPAGRVAAAVTKQSAALAGGRFTATIGVANTGGLPLFAGDAGLLVGAAFIPVPVPIAPGAQSTVRYTYCPLVSGPGRLYSPTYDLFLGPPVTVPVPGC